ncbi:hypothetical protein J4E70_13295, partial [Pseudohalocynthiibacter aestuariivivens]|uniref:hypothetical protein n=1 Tax=Pseudohalocynthiibacter aestuariivivens TaxID=1591409 RepID=UPI001BD69446
MNLKKMTCFEKNHLRGSFDRPKHHFTEAAATLFWSGGLALWLGSLEINQRLCGLAAPTKNGA